jgi:hypothetical protein
LRILDDVGVKIHRLKHLKLHAKMILADGIRGIVGSINLAPGSFDSRLKSPSKCATTTSPNAWTRWLSTTGRIRVRLI